MAKAALALEERGEAVTSRALAAAAHISREHRVRLAQASGNERLGYYIHVISSARALLSCHLTNSKEQVKRNRPERRTLAYSRHEHNSP